MTSSIGSGLLNEAALRGMMHELPWGLLVLLIAICIATLAKGADFLIEGVIDLAVRTRLPSIVIGATIVSLGTTTPEAFVSVMAAWMGNPGLALGNGVGSIIADTGLILGLTCLLTSVPVNRFVLDRTGWVQVGSATFLVVLAAMAYRHNPAAPVFDQRVGSLLLLLLFLYLYTAFRWAGQSGHHDVDSRGAVSTANFSRRQCAIRVGGGLVLMIISARLLIPAASQTAIRIGVPEDVVAATMVAFGTSLPELTAAIAAIRKGHPEITLGNVVGADVLNSLFVIGAAAVAGPLDIPPNFYYFHFPAMLVVLWSFRAFASFNRSGRFQRWQGGWLLGVYLFYVILQYGLNVSAG